MIIIGVDFHPEFQQIALLNTTTGEGGEKRLAHPDEAEKFYRALASAGETVRIGMEATGHERWFERLVAGLQLFWMMRREWDYEQLKKFGSHAGQPGHRDGVQSNTE